MRGHYVGDRGRRLYQLLRQRIVFAYNAMEVVSRMDIVGDIINDDQRIFLVYGPERRK